jgi:phosphatidylserine/phosphatidylglycerophosphate/cardiolipin synthase-like enzyme
LTIVPYSLNLAQKCQNIFGSGLSGFKEDKMAFRIIDERWHETFDSMTKQARKKALIITPFLQQATVKSLLGNNPGEIKAITRFNLDDFLHRVSDIDALDYLLKVGAEIKGIKHLHSKVYIFNSTIAIVTSANLTQAALFRNTECGVESDDRAFVKSTLDYFQSLWV